MADARKCDYCGKYFDYNENDINYIRYGHRADGFKFSNVTTSDACPVCMKSIEGCIESLKQKATNTRYDT